MAVPEDFRTSYRAEGKARGDSALPENKERDSLSGPLPTACRGAS